MDRHNYKSAKGISVSGISPILGFGLICIGTAPAYTQVTEAASSDPEQIVRVEYLRTPQLPNGVAFLETMRLLYVLNNDDPDFATEYVQGAMGLEPAEAASFLTDMLRTFDSVNDDIGVRTEEIACSFGAPKTSGDQVYSIFEAIDDVPESVAESHLDKLKARVGKDHASRLQQWLESQKLNIHHAKTNRKAAFQKRGESADQALALMCASLASDSSGAHQ